MNPLQKFYIDKPVYEGVKEFLTAHLKETALDKVFRGLPTSGIPDAKEAIDAAFAQLEKEYGEKRKVSVGSSE